MTLPRTPSFRLDGKRALVAGASSGIGRGSAPWRWPNTGAEVTLAARSGGQAAPRLAQALAAAGLADADALPLDVARGRRDRARRWPNEGPFDVLVNSPPASRATRPALDTSRRRISTPWRTSISRAPTS
jgi:NAD(P)-dependent dehydrogenase (short-subunit alcohol dehydrogenase family)